MNIFENVFEKAIESGEIQIGTYTKALTTAEECAEFILHDENRDSDHRFQRARQGMQSVAANRGCAVSTLYLVAEIPVVRSAYPSTDWMERLEFAREIIDVGASILRRSKAVR